MSKCVRGVAEKQRESQECKIYVASRVALSGIVSEVGEACESDSGAAEDTDDFREGNLSAGIGSPPYNVAKTRNRGVLR